MESEMLIIQLKNLKLLIGNNPDVITGEKLICYSRIDSMIEMMNHARIRGKMQCKT
jgi:hypothetical protein